MAVWLLMLAVFAGLSMNLVLQFGFGIREIALSEGPVVPGKNTLGLSLQAGAFFASVLLVWLAFALARSLLPLGFLEYVLVFPAGFLASRTWIYLSGRYLPKSPVLGGNGEKDVFGGGALSGGAAFVVLAVAGGFAEALVLSLGFTLGTLGAVVAVAEIKRRAQMEAVPLWLRGAPLTLVAMGLLSLVCSFAAMMFFEVLAGG